MSPAQVLKMLEDSSATSSVAIQAWKRSDAARAAMESISASRRAIETIESLGVSRYQTSLKSIHGALTPRAMTAGILGRPTMGPVAEAIGGKGLVAEWSRVAVMPASISIRSNHLEQLFDSVAIKLGIGEKTLGGALQSWKRGAAAGILADAQSGFGGSLLGRDFAKRIAQLKPPRFDLIAATKADSVGSLAEASYRPPRGSFGLNEVAPKSVLASRHADASDQKAVLASITGGIGKFEIPRSLREFMGAARWPDAVRRGFGVVRDYWERRQALMAAVEDDRCRRILFIVEEMAVGHELELLERLSFGLDPFLDLVEEVLGPEEAIEFIQERLAATPYLRDMVKDDLRDGLERVAEGKYDRAFPPLFVGLEGAFRDGAIARAAAEKRLPPRMPMVRSAIDRSGFDAEQREFLRSDVFSEENNDARHGNGGDRRALSLLMIVGLLCWIDEFTEDAAINWLGDQLAAALRHEERTVLL